MPELPEVETIVRLCRPRLVGRRVVRFSSRCAKQAWPSVAKVRNAIVGHKVIALTRRGKFIVFRFDGGGQLLVHLRMSGRFEWASDHRAEPRHVRAIWRLDDGESLYFCDARKFGRLCYTDDPGEITANLGIEPLASSFTPQVLLSLFSRRARQLKPLLLDQSVIAGLGNIYVDEALFRASLHPLRRANTLDAREVRALRVAIRAVLREAIRRHGTTIDWIYPGGWMQNYLRVYGRAGEPCRSCAAPIVRLRVAQRGTHICPNCQRPDGRRRTGSAGRE